MNGRFLGSGTRLVNIKGLGELPQLESRAVQNLMRHDCEPCDQPGGNGGKHLINESFHETNLRNRVGTLPSNCDFQADSTDTEFVEL